METVHLVRLHHVSGSLPIWPMPAIIIIVIKIIIIIIIEIIIMIDNYVDQYNLLGILPRLCDLPDINNVSPLRKPFSQILLPNLPPGGQPL